MITKENRYYVFGKVATDIVAEGDLKDPEFRVAKKVKETTDSYEIYEFDMTNPNPDLLLEHYDGWDGHYRINVVLYELLKK
ncbi:hypothetical protein CMI37_14765 [Candidatus Pacearchaeota archaeon]|nr:hypothetical protein [Candidatus Pacearchaeota archaeon]|tara:strand:- start:298 stop:540 length:243 start_codon:yes stop_codon:yes gene_type:complete